MNAWNTARDTTRGRVSRMISDLLGSRPSATTGAGAEVGEAELTAWLSRKADTFDQIADINAGDGDVVRAGEARHLAAEARAQATARTRTQTPPLVDHTARVSDAAGPPLVDHTAGADAAGPSLVDRTAGVSAGPPLVVDAADDVLEGDVEVERRQWDDALQVADDRDVVYGDGTAGPARLLRDPVDILADHHARTHPTVAAADDADDADEL